MYLDVGYEIQIIKNLKHNPLILNNAKDGILLGIKHLYTM